MVQRLRAVQRILIHTVAVTTALLIMPLLLGAQSATLSPELEKVRAALEKYRDPIVAVHDGYFSTLGCVYYPQPGGAGRVPYPRGAMGIHFLNPGLITPAPDPLRPQVLLYEPD